MDLQEQFESLSIVKGYPFWVIIHIIMSVVQRDDLPQLVWSVTPMGHRLLTVIMTIDTRKIQTKQLQYLKCDTKVVRGIKEFKNVLIELHARFTINIYQYLQRLRQACEKPLGQNVQAFPPYPYKRQSSSIIMWSSEAPKPCRIEREKTIFRRKRKVKSGLQPRNLPCL